MTDAERVHQTAVHMRELAQDSSLPDYIEKMLRTADALDQHATELARSYTPMLTLLKASGCG